MGRGEWRGRERGKKEKEKKDENNYIFLIPEFNIASLHLPARDGPLKLGRSERVAWTYIFTTKCKIDS